jgi:hypothetical protein
MAEDQDWRLKAELEVEDKRRTLDRLLGRVRGPDVSEEVGRAVSNDVAITHDGKLLFAYAADKTSLATARRAVEAVLRHDDIKAGIFVRHWDERFDEWLQVDPPLTDTAKRTGGSRRACRREGRIAHASRQ